MNDKQFLKHKIFLLSIFVLGNTVIVFPKGLGAPLTALALVVSALPVLYLLYFLIKICQYNTNKLPRIIVLPVILFCFIVFIICTRDYITFVDTMRLPKTPRFLLSIIFIALCVLLGTAKRKVLYTFALFSFIITFLIIITVFLFSIGSIDFSSLRVNDIEMKLLIRKALTFVVHSFGQLIILVFFFRNQNYKQDKKIYVFGVIIGAALMTVYVINILLVLGGEVAGEATYPYSTLTSIISFGRNFSRLDGFTYYIYFYSSIIKNAVCVSVLTELLNIKKKTAVFVLTAVLIIFCNIEALQNFLHTDMANLIVLIFELTFPLLLFLYLKFKSRHIQ